MTNVLMNMSNRIRGVYIPILLRDPSLVRAEPQCYTLFPQHVGREDVVVEVGVFFGGSTLLLARLAREVYSYEANPFNYRIAKSVIERSKAKNVRLASCAIGAADGVLKLKTNGWWSDNSTSSVSGLGRVKYRREVEVEAKKLDSLGVVPDVLIIDAEGSEVAVLEGGSKCLGSLRCLMVEVHAKPESTLPPVLAWAKAKFSNVQVVEGEAAPWVVAH